MLEPHPSLIDLSKGSPSPDLLPVKLLTASFHTIIREQPLTSKSLDYGPSAGDKRVRETIAEWLSRRYALPRIRSERIAITAGASQSLACILQCYTNPQYTGNIFLVAPTYHLVCDIFADHGYSGRLRAIPEDDEGLDVDKLEMSMRESSLCRIGTADAIRRPERKLFKSVIYCVPSFSNPSGKTLSMTRRRQLVQLARHHDALVVSDDVYDFLNWGEKAPLPRLVNIDAELQGGPVTAFGNTISNGSFSKLLGPGLRAGWAEGTPAFIHGLSLYGPSISGGPPGQFTSWVAAEAIASGGLDQHIENVLRPQLERRSQSLLTAIRRFLTPLGVKVGNSQAGVGGGYFLCLELPPGIDSNAFCAQAEQQINLLLASGELFAVHGDEAPVSGRNFVRLCFAYEAEERLVEAVQRMAVLLAKC
ncbi:hypothetical protein Q7P37_002264 [Cladosporium fusiforme]